MRRPSPWLILVVVLLGAFLLREPGLRRVDDIFLAWFLENSEPVLPPAPLTLVEMGREDIQRITPADKRKPLPKGESVRRSFSPLEYALFLQAALEFRPTVIALEPMLIWPESDRLQEQIFIDQAMHVPKLLVALELGGKGGRDLTTDDLATLPNVTGNRGALPQFVGVSRQPDETVRLISTPGFVNLPNERSDRLRVPMLFEYRGEIVPSFPLQAIMLWLRLNPEDVKVELGSRIVLPNGWQIPLHRDGTITLNPAARQSVRHLSLNELLLGAQEHEQHRPSSRPLDNLKDQIVMLRISDDPLQPPDVFSIAIATIQNHAAIRPAPEFVGWIIVCLAAVLAAVLWMISKSNFLLGAILVSAGYALVALGMLGRERLWLPMFPALALLWFLVVVRLFGGPAQRNPPDRQMPA